MRCITIDVDGEPVMVQLQRPLETPEELEALRESCRDMRDQIDAMFTEPCRRCSHTYREHPNSLAVGCAVEGCGCHCFWEQPPQPASREL